MKIRSGFVSNSSSSSFVIHRSYLTDKQVEDMEALYNKLSLDRVQEEQAEDGGSNDIQYIYDENGNSFNISEHYVSFNAYSTPKEWQKFLDKLKLPEGALFCAHEG